MNGEPVGSYLFKQVTGLVIGVILASSFDYGGKAYDVVTHAPKCRVTFAKNNSMGYFYDWKIEVNDTNLGSFLVYPKDEVLIDLDTIQRPQRVVEAEPFSPTLDKKMARGVLFSYLDGSEKIELKFQTYSGRFLNHKKVKELGCDDLLLDM